MKDLEKDLSDIVSEHPQRWELWATVMECNRTGADCECCWNYDEYTIDLSCFCQIVQNKRANVWWLMRCPACSWDYDEVDETPTVSE